MNFRLNRTVASTLAILFLVTGCAKSATGQVAAVVNGEEISIQELNAEIEGLNLPAGVDKKQVLQNVLQKVIDRRLVAQAAKEEGLDRDPSYITRQRKLNEELLVSMFLKKAAESVPVPNAAAIDKYIAAHPVMFSERKRYLVEQIQFDVPSDITSLKRLEGDHSLAEIANSLTSMGIKFQRGNNSIDSGSIPPGMLKTILALPAGEPFVVPAGGKVVASVITGSEPLNVSPEQARQIAAQAIRNEGLGTIGQTRLKDARAKAKIEYQAGYNPPAPKAPAAK